MIQAYLADYYPPVPVLEISLARPMSTLWHGPFTAIVDSGADVTIVPRAILDEFRPPVERRATLTTQWSNRQSVTTYTVDLLVGGLIFPSVEVAGDRIGGEVVLGRNLLNYLDLRLEGPRLRIHLLSV
jgi:hypothetical protein